MTETEITENIITWLDQFISDWGLDEEITEETTFNDDLCFSSVDMMHYLAIIDMNMKKKFPYEKLLMKGGVYRNELSVAELTAFIYNNKDIEQEQPKAI